MHRRSGQIAVFGLIAVFVSSHVNTVFADNLYASHFAGVNEKACYARLYTKEHLKKHPKQKVEEITIRQVSEPWADLKQDKIPFDIKLGLTTKDSPDLLSEIASCETDGDTATCHLYGPPGVNRGVLKLSAKDKDTLIVRSNAFILVGDDKEYVFGADSDDKVFHIKKGSVTDCIPFQ